jgi:hypothetical protein
MATGKLISVYSDITGQLGGLSQYANSAAPAAAVLSNSVPSYATLGGLYNFAAPASAETDFALFGWSAPGALAAVQAHLFITDIQISLVNTGAAVATTPTIVEWGLAVNSTAASLATTDGGGTGGVFGPRRLSLGSQTLLVGALIGSQPPIIQRIFGALPIVEPGRFMHIFFRVPVGTATASQVLRGSISINGYFGS